MKFYAKKIEIFTYTSKIKDYHGVALIIIEQQFFN